MCVFYQHLFESKWSFSCASTAWNWSAINKHKLWKGNFLSFSNQCNCTQCNRRTLIFFDIEFFCLFRRSDLSYSWSGSCRSVVFASYWICLMISDLFLCRTRHFSKVLSQYCRVVKTYKPIWLYRTRNDMYVDLSFSESAHKSRNKFLNKTNPSCETMQKQQLWFQPRRLIYCKKSFAFLVSKTSSSKHMTIENLNAFCLHTFLYKSVGLFSNTEFRLCTFHVNETSRVQCLG